MSLFSRIVTVAVHDIDTLSSSKHIQTNINC